MGYPICHIEKLPEDIILHILQSLPLVDAVATRSLSRMWNNLWKKSCSQRLNLCFDVDNLFAVSMPVSEESGHVSYRKILKRRDGYYCRMSSQIIEDFVKGVDMIVQCRRSEKQDVLWGVNSLEIRFPLRGMHSDHIDNWISSTVTSTTKQLILVFRLPSDIPNTYRNSDFYKFPFELLLNQKNLGLEYLQLEFISTKLPQNFYGFTALRTLKLNRTNLTNEDAHKLLINCPLLEFLEIKDCQNLVALQVSSPLPYLKVLILVDCYDFATIELWAENLSSFQYDTATSMDHLMLRECHNLTKVAVCCLYNIDDEYFRPLSIDFPFVRSLYLDTYLKDLNVVLRDNIFAHLKFLSIFLFVDNKERNIQYLSSLLDVAAPMLEELEIHVRRCSTAKCPNTNNQRIDSDHYNHLKRVVFTGFTGETGETELAKYFLMKARRLQVMIIDHIRKSYKNFDAIERWQTSKEIDKRCMNAYKFLCNLVPANAKLILVGNY